MKLGELEIHNYKALKEVRIPLSKFVCLIGENNAGKSSVLQAVKLLIDGGTWERYWPRRDLLEAPPNDAIRKSLVALPEGLRSQGIFVWEKGAIEEYYPEGIVGDGKLARAISCCAKIISAADARALCASDHRDSSGKTVTDFDAIFSHIIDQ